MVEFYAKRIGRMIVPVGDESIKEFEKLPHTKILKVTTKRERSDPQRRFYWMLLRRIGDAMDRTPEEIHHTIKIGLGFYHLVRLKGKAKGRIIAAPRSTTELEQDDFNEYFERAIRFCYDELEIPPECIADLVVPTEMTR